LPCPRISATGLSPENRGQRFAERAVSHQHRRAGRIVHVAAVPYRHSDPQERSHMNDRPHPHLRDAERDHRRGMAVHHRHHVAARLVDFTVDEPFDHAAAVLRIDRIGIEVVFHDVVRGHQDRRERARQQVAVWVARMAHAHMPIGIEHALLGENAVGGDEVLDERRVDRTGARRRLRLGAMGTCNEQQREGERADSDRSHRFSPPAAGGWRGTMP